MSVEVAVTSVENLLRSWSDGRTGVACTVIDGSHMLAEGERKLTSTMTATRLAEFAAGRWCGHKALSEIGADIDTISTGSFSNPIWPTGTVGSIAHDAGLALAIAKHSAGVCGIGVDLLASGRSLPNSAMNLILSENEYVILHQFAPELTPEKLGFCVKEAVIKCVSPILQDFIDFREIRIFPSRADLSATVSRLQGRIHIRTQTLPGFLLALAERK